MAVVTGVPLDVTIRDLQGDVLPGTPVNVLAGAGPGLQQVYTDRALTSPVAQPLVTDANGQITQPGDPNSYYWWSGVYVTVTWTDASGLRKRPVVPGGGLTEQEVIDLLQTIAVTLESFGADPTGVVPCDDAIDDAWAYLNAAPNRSLLVARGLYYFTREIPPLTQNGTAIFGDGRGISVMFTDDPSVANGFTVVGPSFDNKINVKIVDVSIEQRAPTPAAGYALKADAAIDSDFRFATAGFGGITKIGETLTTQRFSVDVQGTWNANLGLAPILHYRAINATYRGKLNGIGQRHVVPRGYVEIRSPDAGPGFPGQDTSDFDISIQYVPTTGLTTTIAAGSNGVDLLTEPAEIFVDSTDGFPNAGAFRIFADTGNRLVRYTGKTAGSFTGCNVAGTFSTIIQTGDTATYVELVPEGYWWGVLVQQAGTGSTVNQWFTKATIDHWTCAGIAYIVTGTRYVRHHHFSDIRTTGEVNRSSGVGLLVAHNPQLDAANRGPNFQSVSVDGIVLFCGSRAAVISGGNELQRILVMGDGGTVRFGVDTGAGVQWTGALPVFTDDFVRHPTDVEVETALAGLAGVGANNVRVFGGAAGPVDETRSPPLYWTTPYLVLFCGALANTAVTLMSGDATNLTTSFGTPSVDITKLAPGRVTDCVKSVRLRAHLNDVASGSMDDRDAAVTIAAENCQIEAALDYAGVTAGNSKAFLEVVKDVSALVVKPSSRLIKGTNATKFGRYYGTEEIIHYNYAANSEKRQIVPGAMAYGAAHGDRLTQVANVTVTAGQQFVLRTPFIPNVRVFKGIRFRLSSAAAGVGNVRAILYDQDGNIVGLAAALSVAGTGAGTIVDVPFVRPIPYGPGVGFMSLSFDDACPVQGAQNLAASKVVNAQYGTEANPIVLPTGPSGTLPVMSLYAP